MAAILVTGGGNIPLNRALDRSNLDQATKTRERFVCMCWALIAFGAL